MLLKLEGMEREQWRLDDMKETEKQRIITRERENEQGSEKPNLWQKTKIRNLITNYN